MDGGTQALVSLAILVLSAFFVLAEYALVGTRRSRVEALAKKGARNAKLVLATIDDMPAYIAGIQLGITMAGIGLGSVAEPFVTRNLQSLLGGAVPRQVSFGLAFLTVTYVVVVVGELVPKYVALAVPERLMFLLVRPLRLFVAVLRPLINGIQWSGKLILRPFGIKIERTEEAIPRDELLLMIRSGGAAGLMQEGHANLVTRALKLDELDASDIMIHRLDVKWIDLATPREEIFAKVAAITHTRIPVCRGDIDDVAGILYLHDLISHWESETFDLEGILRPAVVIPENLSMDRIVARMREMKTQMLVIMDEYGGTSGIVTLEDVVEEVFGELEDRLESERPPIEVLPSGRVSARADVRFDELATKLEVELMEPNTDMLATMIVEGLERVPKPGDSIQTELGMLIVENMARRRITRVSLYPK